MNIFFDVDYTILGMDDTLRPGTKEVFRQLHIDGHKIYIWSGNGIRWHEVRLHGLDPYVVDCFQKPLYRFEEQMKALGIPIRPDLVVDDYQEVPEALGGIWAHPYFLAKESTIDQEMDWIYEMINTYEQHGKVSHVRFFNPKEPSPHP